jgi:hypothetical protein
MAPRFETLADLHNERCNLLIHCRGCEQYRERTAYQLAGVPWAPDALPDNLDELTIAGILDRLKCRRCGGRDVEWWPTRTGAAMNDWYVTGSIHGAAD